MKIKKKYKFKLINKILIIIIITITISFNMFNYYSNNIQTKLISITKFKLNNYTNKVILDKIDHDMVGEQIMDIIILNKNNGDIVSIDYNVDKTYEILRKGIDDIYDSIGKSNDFDEELESHNFILSYPIGLASKSVILNNLGPKIPIKINMINNVKTSLSTRVTNYGINNILLEMYIVINVNHQIIYSYIEEVNESYEILVASTLLPGKIPNIYGGTIEKNSTIVS